MKHNSSRLLAVNVRATRIGFALFSNIDQLLDWGTRSIIWSSHSREGCRKQIASLFAMYSPATIVLYCARRKRDVDPYCGSAVIEAIRHEADVHSTAIVRIMRKDVLNVYSVHRAANKYQMAAFTVEFFPELRWRLPSSRRQWQSEPRVMLLFDAITAGFAYWQKRGIQPTATGEKSSSF